MLNDIDSVAEIRALAEKRIDDGLADNFELLSIYKSIVTGKSYYIVDASEVDEW